MGSNLDVYDTFPHLFSVTLGSDASTGANAHHKIETKFDPEAVVLRIDVPTRYSNLLLSSKTTRMANRLLSFWLLH